MARLHFPIDFRRARTPFRDSPAFPADCLPFFPAVLRPLSQGRRGILLAHHGYTWWMRYGQTKEKGHRGPPVQTGNPHTPVVQDEIKDPERIQKRSDTGFPKKKREPKQIQRKTAKGFSPLRQRRPKGPKPANDLGPTPTSAYGRAFHVHIKNAKKQRPDVTQANKAIPLFYKSFAGDGTSRFVLQSGRIPPPMRRGLQNPEGIL